MEPGLSCQGQQRHPSHTRRDMSSWPASQGCGFQCFLLLAGVRTVLLPDFQAVPRPHATPTFPARPGVLSKERAGANRVGKVTSTGDVPPHLPSHIIFQTVMASSWLNGRGRIVPSMRTITVIAAPWGTLNLTSLFSGTLLVRPTWLSGFGQVRTTKRERRSSLAYCHPPVPRMCWPGYGAPPVAGV